MQFITVHVRDTYIKQMTIYNKCSFGGKGSAFFFTVFLKNLPATRLVNDPVIVKAWMKQLMPVG